MIEITHKVTHFPGVRVQYRSYDNGNIKLQQQKNQAIYFHRQPVLNIQQPRKRSSSYLKLQNNKDKQNFDTRSQMQSNLSRLNQELQERTNYYARHGKYDSKWTQEHHDNFKSTQRSSSSHSGGSSRYRPITTQQRPEEYYRPPSVKAEPIYLPTSYEPMVSLNPNVGHYVTYNDPVRNYSNNGGELSKNVYEAAYTAGQAKQKVKQSAKDVAIDVAETANAVYDTAKEAKDVVKDQTKQAAHQVKEGAKQATKAVVGPQNYSLLSTIKNAFTNLFKNAMQPIVEVKDAVVDQAALAKDVVVGQAKNAKDAVQDATKDAKQSVKQGVRDAKNSAKMGVQDARYAVKQGVRDLNEISYDYRYSPQFRSKESIDSSLSSLSSEKAVGGRQVYYQKIPRHYDQKPHHVTKSPYVNEVSPIEYSKRQFSQPPMAKITYFWIYMLLAIGVFLVIFQILK